MSITETKQRVISADSHMTITNESIFEHLPKKYVADVEDWSPKGRRRRRP